MDVFIEAIKPLSAKKVAKLFTILCAPRLNTPQSDERKRKIAGPPMSTGRERRKNLRFVTFDVWTSHEGNVILQKITPILSPSNSKTRSKSTLLAWCRHCGHEQQFRRRKLNHRRHAVLSLFTLGIWLIPWFALTIGTKISPWECDQCGTEPRIKPPGRSDLREPQG